MYFKNRQEAGRKLADRLVNLETKKTAILALPRGGVPVAYEISKALSPTFDTIVSMLVAASDSVNPIGGKFLSNLNGIDLYSLKEG